MNVLIRASTFGADLFWFAHYLDQIPGVQMKVILSDPDKFRQEGIFRQFPLKAELIEHSLKSYFLRPKGFKPDLTILDNFKAPVVFPSPKGLMLWHGFGWKGPNDIKEFFWVHVYTLMAWGFLSKRNPDFIWQCFGDWDYEHRTKISGIHPDNCRVFGAASHDLLRNPIPKEHIQSYYPFDVVHKKTILIAPTWHYGEVFSHWGSDEVLFRKLFTKIREYDANVILRLHDSYRFAKDYISLLEDLAEKYPNVILKFKDKHQDNLMDMMASDVLITNFSSIANLYYATGRPTIHVYPVKNEDEEFQWKKNTILGVRTKKIDSVKYIWKLSPEENGGLVARDFSTLIEQLEMALEDENCCKEKSEAFLNKYMLGADGKSCERIWNAVTQMVNK